MLFNSTVFVFFLFIVLFFRAFYSKIPWNVAKICLLCFSYLFYAWWFPPFVVFLFLSSYVDFILGNRIVTHPQHKKLYLTASCIVNLGILGFFKYANFFIENINWLAGLIGFEFQVTNPSILLPVGISFYTFQSMSYTIDIYRGNFKPVDSAIDFFLYVSFFPQLVAGPIVRAKDFLPQTRSYTPLDKKILSIAIPLIVFGYFKKVVLADQIAELVDDFFRNTDFTNIHSIRAWIVMYAYSFQIFCDFSGYSDIAIGIAYLLGFKFPKNFNNPYFACGFKDFWSRWHISLSTWLKDYLYIPLGGNRKGSFRTYINLMLTMLLGGLWHGASWNFIAWGGLHGAYLIGERMIRRHENLQNQPHSFWGRLVGVFITFHLTTIAWVFFRAQSFSQAFQILGAMFFNFNTPLEILHFARLSSVFLFLIVVYYALKYVGEFMPQQQWKPRFAMLFALAGAIELVILFWGRSNAFIYFQF
ncbi:MBOAT family protein [candidate division KSB1 bacterium]|nr:MBOAT family protein [candidate division KSB1 bacterium]